MADAITVLHQEIATLERELAKRRTALAALNGAQSQGKSPTATRPSPRPAKRGGLPLGARIVSYLKGNKGKQFTPVQIAEALAKTDKSVERANVQRRLGELFKRKQLRRENGRYGMA